MRKLQISAPFIILALLHVSPDAANAAQDLFKEHSKAMNSKADAHAVEIFGAWGDNMANRIENGMADGVVVKDGHSNSKNVTTDGAGNVVVKKGAKIQGPLIIKNDINNSTIISR